MRKTVVSALMMILLLLPGCGEREARLQEGFGTLRQTVTDAGSIRFQAALTADYGEVVEDYTLAASYDGQETVVEVLAPELIAGVKARALRGETSVEYDGAILGAGPLDGEGLTAMSAIPVMLDALASSYVELLWWDGDYIAARLYVGETSVVTVWLDQNSFAPTAMEVASEGRTVIKSIITGWEAG